MLSLQVIFVLCLPQNLLRGLDLILDDVPWNLHLAKSDAGIVCGRLRQ